MKHLPGFLTLITAISATAAPFVVTDPAAQERHHAIVRAFDLKSGSYHSVKGDGLILDGNEGTGLKFSAGRRQLIFSLRQADNISSISLVGTGRARFTISVGNDNAAPGSQWQTVLKNVPLSAGWGSDRAINRTARYVLIETDAASEFVISEIGLYGKLVPVASQHRYLSDVWRSNAADRLTPIHSGPSVKSAFKPGGLGFPPRMNSGVNTRMPIAHTAPRGRIGIGPTPLRAR